jgi:hypothetical protein
VPRDVRAREQNLQLLHRRDDKEDAPAQAPGCMERNGWRRYNTNTLAYSPNRPCAAHWAAISHNTGQPRLAQDNKTYPPYDA